MPEGSAGVRRRFLNGAEGGSVQDGGVGSQHEAAWFLGGSLGLGGGLRGRLVLLRREGGGGEASVWVHLGRSRCLVVAVMLRERRGHGEWWVVAACEHRATDT